MGKIFGVNDEIFGANDEVVSNSLVDTVPGKLTDFRVNAPKITEAPAASTLTPAIVNPSKNIVPVYETPKTQVFGQNDEVFGAGDEIVGPAKPAEELIPPQKEFETRMNNPDLVIHNPDGTVRTHKMAYGNYDGKNIAFPTIVNIGGTLKELPMKDAQDYAIKNNEYKAFDTPQEAEEYAAGSWKKGTIWEQKPEEPSVSANQTLLQNMTQKRADYEAQSYQPMFEGRMQMYKEQGLPDAEAQAKAWASHHSKLEADEKVWNDIGKENPSLLDQAKEAFALSGKKIATAILPSTKKYLTNISPLSAYIATMPEEVKKDPESIAGRFPKLMMAIKGVETTGDIAAGFLPIIAAGVATGGIGGVGLGAAMARNALVGGGTTLYDEITDPEKKVDPLEVIKSAAVFALLPGVNKLPVIGQKAVLESVSKAAAVARVAGQTLTVGGLALGADAAVNAVEGKNIVDQGSVTNAALLMLFHTAANKGVFTTPDIEFKKANAGKYGRMLFDKEMESLNSQIDDLKSKDILTKEEAASLNDLQTKHDRMQETYDKFFNQNIPTEKSNQEALAIEANKPPVETPSEVFGANDEVVKPGTDVFSDIMANIPKPGEKPTGNVPTEENTPMPAIEKPVTEEKDIDTRTGLPASNISISRINEYKKNPNVTMLYFDIDDFKSINDEFGHDTGNEVLTAVGAKVRQYLPGAIATGRIGGEEFYAAFPTDFNYEVEAKNLLHGIPNEVKVADGGNQHPVTISGGIGVGTVPTETGQERVYADKLLYEAKKERGKNQIVVDKSGKKSYITGKEGLERPYVERYRLRVLEEGQRELLKKSDLSGPDRAAIKGALQVIKARRESIAGRKTSAAAIEPSQPPAVQSEIKPTPPPEAPSAPPKETVPKPPPTPPAIGPEAGKPLKQPTAEPTSGAITSFKDIENPNSTENEVRTRLRPTQDAQGNNIYVKNGWFRKTKWKGVEAPAGVTFVIGQRADNGNHEIQTIRYDRSKVTPQQAYSFYKSVVNKPGFEKTWKEDQWKATYPDYVPNRMADFDKLPEPLTETERQGKKDIQKEILDQRMAVWRDRYSKFALVRQAEPRSVLSFRKFYGKNPTMAIKNFFDLKKGNTGTGRTSIDKLLQEEGRREGDIKKYSSMEAISQYVEDAMDFYESGQHNKKPTMADVGTEAENKIRASKGEEQHHREQQAIREAQKAKEPVPFSEKGLTATGKGVNLQEEAKHAIPTEHKADEAGKPPSVKEGAPSRGRLDRVLPESISAARDESRRITLLGTINTRLERAGYSGVVNDADLEFVAPSPALDKAIRTLRVALPNVKVSVFRIPAEANKNPKLFDGFYSPIAKESFIREGIDNPYVFTAVHEVLHDVQDKYPELAKPMYDEFKASLSSEGLTELGRLAKLHGSEERALKEMSADWFASNTKNLHFWANMFEKAPEFTKRILKRMIAIFRKIRNVVEFKRFKDVWVGDVARLERAMSEFLRNVIYAEQPSVEARSRKAGNVLDNPKLRKAWERWGPTPLTKRYLNELLGSEQPKRTGPMFFSERTPAETYINGNKGVYTGKVEQIHGGTFYTVKMLEGEFSGKERVTSRPPGEVRKTEQRQLPGTEESQTAKDIERVKRERAESATAKDKGTVDLPLFNANEAVRAAEAQQTLFSEKEPKPIFYSALSRAFEGAPAKLDNMTGVQWKQWLESNKGKIGVKNDEIEWTGINDYLDLKAGERLTKAQIAEYLDQNGVKVEEVEKGTKVFPLEWREQDVGMWIDVTGRYSINKIPAGAGKYEYRLIGPKGLGVFDNSLAILKDRAAQEDANTASPYKQTKFDRYQLPGGTNYRELLLTLPTPTVDRYDVVNAKARMIIYHAKTRKEAQEFIDTTGLPGKLEIVKRKDVYPDKTFQSSHFDEPNILAHIRMNDRTDADGNKVLFIEEMQSDWAQKGRKEGFAGELPWPVEKIGDRYLVKHPDGKTTDFATQDQATMFAQRHGNVSRGPNVPSAPFVTNTKSWLSLSMKRIIRYAAENGYQKVAWTTGAQQKDRYNLSKQIKALRVRRDKPGKYTIVAELPGSTAYPNALHEFGQLDERDLSEHVGKELAEKIVAQKEEYHKYEGLDLEVGGEGMTAFYDGIVPQVANDILKKVGGGKVGQTELKTVPAGEISVEPITDVETKNVTSYGVFEKDEVLPLEQFENKEDATLYAEELKNKRTNAQPSFDITESMRDKVMEGLPLFSEKGNFLADAVEQIPATNELFQNKITRPALEAKITATPTGVFGKMFQAMRNFRKEIIAIPKYEGAKKLILNWDGRAQKVSYTAANLVNEIKKQVPDPAKRRALNVYREAAGNLETIKGWAEQTTDKETKSDYELAQHLTDQEKGVADWLGKVYDRFLARGQEQEILKAGRENYINRVIAQEGKPTGYSGKLMSKFRFAKERVFPTIFDAEQAGYKVATKDVADLLGMYVSEMGKVMTTRELIHDLTKIKASDGRPLAVTAGIANSVGESEGAQQKIPEINERNKLTYLVNPRAKDEDYSDYKNVDNYALTKWKWVATTEEGDNVLLQGNLIIHPEVYKLIKNALGHSMIRDWYLSEGSMLSAIPKGMVRFVDVGQQNFKQAMFALSGFHWVQEGTHAVGHTVNPVHDIPTIDLEKNSEHQDAADHGLRLAGDYNAMASFREGLGSGPLMYKIPGVGPFLERISEPLFTWYIPGLKYKTYLHILERNTKRFKNEISSGTVTLDDVKYLSAMQSNAAYGHINYAEMGRNPTIQHLMRMFLIAPDFLEARARFVGQAAKVLAGGKVGREQFRALAVLAAIMYVGSRILNEGLDKDPHWDEPFGVVYKDMIYSLRSVPGDLLHLATQPHQFISGRVAPVVGKTAMWLLTGKDYRGLPQGGMDFLKELIVAWAPISLRGWVPGADRNKDINAYMTFLNALGVKVNRYSPLTRVYGWADDWREKNKIPKDTGLYPPSKYRDLRNALQDMDDKKSNKEWRKLIDEKGMKKADIIRGFRSSLFKPIVGSQANDKKFRDGLNPVQKQVYDNAMEDRKEIWKEFVRIKKLNPQEIKSLESEPTQKEE